MEVAIVGGGIAGLTMAIALQKANIPFVVYEAAHEIKPVGAGIAIANNAMQVYRYLGVSEALGSKGTRISTVLLTDQHLKILTQSDLTPFEQKYQLANIAIHRSELHQVLLDKIGREPIALNKRLTAIAKNGEGLYELLFTDGTRAVHKYVIGADGIRSQVRELVFGTYALRDAQQVCWRGVLDFTIPKVYENTALEGWGTESRFGFVKLGSKEVYWYFLVNEEKYKQTPELGAHLSACHPLVQTMINETPPEHIFKDKIYDLSLINEWHKEGVAIIGDAAHATTPNLGQGACQAIEDVYVISKLLEKHTLDEALQKFSAIRRPKAHAVVGDSWRLGKVAQWNNPLLIAIRNTVFRLLPAFAKNKQMQQLFELQKV